MNSQIKKPQMLQRPTLPTNTRIHSLLQRPTSSNSNTNEGSLTKTCSNYKLNNNNKSTTRSSDDLLSPNNNSIDTIKRPTSALTTPISSGIKLPTLNNLNRTPSAQRLSNTTYPQYTTAVHTSYSTTTEEDSTQNIEIKVTPIAKSACQNQIKSAETTPNKRNILVGSKIICLKEHTGKVAFVGATSFADGMWYGIILEEPKGKNNGTVRGESYFTCEPNYGIFVRGNQIELLDSPLKNGTNLVQPASSALPITRTGSSLPPPTCSTPTGNRPQSSASNHSKLPFNVGDRVVVSNKKGVVRYIGRTNFAKGDWVGVELDSPEGKNNGTIEGIKYFTCAPKHGLFALTSKVLPLKSDTSSKFRTPPQSQQIKRVMNNSSRMPLKAVSNYNTPINKDRPNSRNSSSSLSSTGRGTRNDPDIDLEAHITTLKSKLIETNNEKAKLEAELTAEKDMKEVLLFEKDEREVSADSATTRTKQQEANLKEKVREVNLLQTTIKKLEGKLAQTYADSQNTSSDLEELRDKLQIEQEKSKKLEEKLQVIEIVENDNNNENNDDSDTAQYKQVETPLDIRNDKILIESRNKELIEKLSEKEAQLALQINNINNLQQQIGSLKEDLLQRTDSLRDYEIRFEKVTQDREYERRKSVEELEAVEKNKLELMESSVKLKAECENVKNLLREKDMDLQRKELKLEAQAKEMTELKTQLETTLEHFQSEKKEIIAPITSLMDEKAALEAALSSLKLEKSQSSNELVTKLQTITVENENLSLRLEEKTKDLEQTKLKLSKKEEEYFLLQEKVSENREKLTNTEKERNDSFAYSKSLEVELEKKTEKLLMLEEINFAASDTQNISFSTVNDIDQINENPLGFFDIEDKFERSSVEEPEIDYYGSLNSQTLNARLYCDICEVFDEHETDECPIQNQRESNSPPHGDFDTFSTPSERPYCDNCEVFGHYTEDCCDQQCF